MPAEEIQIDLKSNSQAFFAELDRKFDEIAVRFGAKLGAGSASGGGSSGGGLGIGAALSALGPEGMVAGAAASGLSAVAGVASAGFSGFVSGAGQGISQTAPAALGDPSVLLANAAVSGIGGALNDTVGKVPILGEYVMAQWNSWEQEIRSPAESVGARVKSHYQELARYGIGFNPSDIDSDLQRGIGVEDRAFGAGREVDAAVQRLERDRTSGSILLTIARGLSWNF